LPALNGLKELGKKSKRELIQFGAGASGIQVPKITLLIEESRGTIRGHIIWDITEDLYSPSN